MLIPIVTLLGAAASAASSLTYQQRIAITPNNGMNVAFNSKGNNTELMPRVFFGTDENNLSNEAAGLSSMYETSLSTTHKVQLRDLAPDTQYFYQTCLDVYGQCRRSEMLSFKSAVSSGSTEEFKFAVLGDMGVMGPLGGCLY